MPSAKFQIADLSLGLATKARPSRIPPGACQAGSKNFFLYRDVLATAPGNERVTNSVPDQHSILLDASQYFIGYSNNSGTKVNLAQPTTADPWTLEVVFRMDRYPTDKSDDGYLYSTLLYKGAGAVANTRPTAANTEYFLAVKFQSGLVCVPSFSITNTTPAVVSIAGGTNNTIKLGVYYHIAIVKTAAGNITMYANVAGSTPNTTYFSTAGATPIGTINTRASDLFVGAMPESKTGTTPAKESGLVQFPFQGVIQEVRYWQSDRTASLGTYLRQLTDAEVAAETNLIGYYRGTGVPERTYFYESETGTSGQGSGQVPILSLQPRQATWLTSGHPLGNPIGTSTASIHLDGRGQGLEVLNSYLYRSEIIKQGQSVVGTTTSDFSDLQKSRDRLAISFNVKTPPVFKDQAKLFHWTHIPDDQFGSIVSSVSSTATASTVALASANEEWSAFLDIKQVGGNWRFRGGIRFEGENLIPAPDVPAYIQAIIVDTSTNLAVNTEYTVTFTFDFALKVLNLYVDGAASAAQNMTNANIDLDTDSTYLRATPNDPIGSLKKNWMVIGRHIYRVRKLNEVPGDPNSVDVEYDFSKSFEGVIRRVVIATSDTLTELAGTIGPFGLTVQSIVMNDQVDRGKNATSGVVILSAWKMDEGSGSFIEDVGLQSNGIDFTVDSNHRFGKSGFTTAERDPPLGLVEHRYRTATGEEKKIVAVTPGCVYEVDQGAGTLTFLADGLRNDDKNNVSALHHQDSTILCMGGIGENYSLWKQHLFRLSIEPPSGQIPWGLSEQTSPKAMLDPGVRNYTFTYFSAFQNKRSAPGPVVSTEIRAKRANVTFGTNAEINQTRPTTGASANAETFDFSKTGGQIYGFQFIAYYGSSGSKAATDPSWWRSAPGSGGASEAKQKKLKLTRNLFIVGAAGNETAASTDKKEDETTVAQVAAAVSNKSVKAQIEELPGGTMELVGAFAGANGQLSIKDLAGENLTGRATGPIDWGYGAGGQVYTGTGVSGHGLGLPVSTDPQVTHLEIWRTLAGGSQFRLVARIPNGAQNFVDNIADENLVGEVLNTNQAAVPATKYALDFGGRAIYFGDDLSPQRVYISEVGEPWNVPPQNTIDFLDGTTLAITGGARTENALTFFKNDTTFVLSKTGDPTFPFQVETRMRDIGCVAPRGIVNVNEVFYYPDEQGFYGYDTSTPRKISEVIQDTWDAVSAANYGKIVSAHDRQNDCILWFVPSGSSFEPGSEIVCNDQAIVWSYGKGQGPDGGIYGWSFLDGLYVKFVTTIQDENEVNRVWFVDPLGYIYIWNSGTNYGVGTLTSRTPALAGSPGTFSTTQLTLAQATLANVPDGYKGFAVTVVKASTGERATRLCVADTLASPSVITLDHALPFTPANTSDFSVIIGSIETRWISGEMSPAGQDSITKLVNLHMQLGRQSADVPGRFDLKWALKHGHDPALNTEATFYEAQTTLRGISNQLSDYRAALGGRGLRVRFTFESLAADVPFEIQSIFPEWDADAGRGQFRNDNA